MSFTLNSCVGYALAHNVDLNAVDKMVENAKIEVSKAKGTSVNSKQPFWGRLLLALVYRRQDGTFQTDTGGTFQSVTAGTFHPVMSGTLIPLLSRKSKLR